MQGNTQAFIVRIWFEETDGEDGALVRRGSIEHVSSKKRLSFEDLAEILRFIEEQTGSYGRDSPSGTVTCIEKALR